MLKIKIKRFHFMEGYNYNKIAQDYHSKRRKPWRPLEFFVSYLKKKKYNFSGICLDLGCANGRNFKILGSPPKKLVGIDISIEFLKIAQKDLKDSRSYSKEEAAFIQIILADIRYLPIRTESIDNIYSIATIHHVKRRSDRKKLISQLENILKRKGNLIITVWRKWQKEYKSYFFIDGFKRRFSLNYKEQQRMAGLNEHGDKVVPWTLSRENKTYNRFYHFFSKHEIKKLLEVFDIKEFKIMGGAGNSDNFFIFAQKK
ncbi:MAG: class I SAM-dependent methyltransferase [Promethearchaeota archaeon]